MKNLLPKVKASETLPQGWVVETPTHVLHSTVSKEYTAAAAVHLSRFDKLFRSIFQGDYKDLRKPVAYAFATEDEYLKFSPSSNGTQGRFLRKPEGKNVLKDLAWFCTPPGEKDFYKTDLKVVQHEATHQLLDAYTDNPGIPKWFHEGCATFFESWDLDKKNADNILSGLGSEYALGICLTYPNQKTTPPLASYWIKPRDLLNLDAGGDEPEETGLRPPKEQEDIDVQFDQEMRAQQEYNQCWCALTFFIDHKKGQEIFKLFVRTFREPGTDLKAIRKKYYSEEFMTSFQVEWYKFIETKVLGKWELPTVGGAKLPVGSMSPAPRGTKGYPLTSDGRGDMFLVKAEGKELDLHGDRRKVWMLKAWSVPTSFYDEAWAYAPEVLSGKGSPLVGGIYGLSFLTDPDRPEFAALFLVPAWFNLSSSDSEALDGRLTQAAGGLISTAER